MPLAEAAAGEVAAIDEHHLDDLAKTQRAQGEIVATQFGQKRQADDDGGDRRDQPAQHHGHRIEIVDARPGIIERTPEVVAAPQDGGRVGAQAEEGVVAQADLATKAGDQVPALRHDGVDEDEEQEGEGVRVDRAGQQRHQRQGGDDDNGDPCPGLFGQGLLQHDAQAFL
jgi:hypothetical protein